MAKIMENEMIYEKMLAIEIMTNNYKEVFENPLLKVIEDLQKEVNRLKAINLTTLTDKQCNAIKIQIERSESVLKSVLKAIMYVDEYMELIKQRNKMLNDFFKHTDETLKLKEQVEIKLNELIKRHTK